MLKTQRIFFLGVYPKSLVYLASLGKVFFRNLPCSLQIFSFSFRTRVLPWPLVLALRLVSLVRVSRRVKHWDLFQILTQGNDSKQPQQNQQIPLQSKAKSQAPKETYQPSRPPGHKADAVANPRPQVRDWASNIRHKTTKKILDQVWTQLRHCRYLPGPFLGLEWANIFGWFANQE